MRQSSDRYKVQFVGGLAVAIGLVLLIVTIFGTLAALFTFQAKNALAAVATFFLCLILSSSYLGLGTKLTRLKYITAADIETLRLSWTSLVLLSVIGAICAFWLLQPLVGICGLMIIVLFAIRGAVIRLSN